MSEKVFIMKGLSQSSYVNAKAETKKFNEPETYVIEDVQLDSQGIARKVRKVITKTPYDNVKDYKWQDFTIENLQAVGADKMLQKVTLSGDIDDTLNNINKLMDEVDAVDFEIATRPEETVEKAVEVSE